MFVLYSDFDKKDIQNTMVFSYNGGKLVGGTTVQRDKLAKIILLAILFPFIVYIFGSCVLNYIPPTESYKKTPKQFEELFNEKMAQYGMSMDIDSVEYTDVDSLNKTVPIMCTDGSKVSCTLYPTGTGSRALIMYLEFEQELSGCENETVYLEPLLTFVMDEFAPKMTVNKDESFEPFSSVSYNGALLACQEFVNGSVAKTNIYISPEDDNEFAVTFKRKSDEKTTLSVRFHLLN